VLLVIVTITLRYTTIGVRLRALADNPTMFALFGHDVRHYRLVAFAFAGGVASASALASAYDVGFTPHGGLHAILLAIVAVIIGGRSSFVGPVVGALVVGAVRALVCYSAAQWQDGATFALLALFLLLRPRGILARVTRVEATS
jgi:branched-chain amino acid transport system permease protein